MTDQPSGNDILGVLPEETLRALAPETSDYELGQELFSPDETPRYVYFGHHPTVVSIVRSTEEGTMVEAGVIGCEGLLSIHTLIAEPAPTGSRAIIQTAGQMSRVELTRAREVFRDHPRFREVALAFTSAMLSQVTQNLVCNRLHEIERRLAKWLLLVHDRTGSCELRLTHEYLSHMLGVHRPGASIAVGALAMDGLIDHGRNRITILDCAGLVARSCECYAAVHATLLQLRATLGR